MVRFTLLYYIPFGVCISLNLVLLFFIFLLRNFGQGVVWVNDKIAFYGDKFGDKAHGQDKIDDFISKIDEIKARRK